MRRDGIRLNPRLRGTFYAVFALLFASGTAWWILQTWGRHQGEFGLESNPLAPWLLKMHGAAAMAALALLGVLYPVHLVRGWRARRNRFSGAGLAAACLSLTVTGYLLYYAGSESSRALAGRVHLWLGLALPAIIAGHIFLGRKTRVSSRLRRDLKPE